MKYKLFTLLCFTLVLTLSCDSNLYYFANERATVTVGDVEVDVAYIQDNCNYVKSQYESRVANGDVLTEADRYRFASSIFACSGYNVTRNLKMLINTDNADIDPYDLIFSLMGVNLIYQTKIDSLKAQYSAALEQCSYAKSNNFKLMCGFISEADNIMVISNIVLVALSAVELRPSQKQIESALKLQNVEIGTLQNLIDGLAAGDPKYLSNLTQNYFAVTEAVNIIETIAPGISFAKQLAELNADMLDESTQRVTQTYLTLKIYSLFNLDTTATP